MPDRDFPDMGFGWSDADRDIDAKICASREARRACAALRRRYARTAKLLQLARHGLPACGVILLWILAGLGLWSLAAGLILMASGRTVAAIATRRISPHGDHVLLAGPVEGVVLSLTIVILALLAAPHFGTGATRWLIVNLLLAGVVARWPKRWFDHDASQPVGPHCAFFGECSKRCALCGGADAPDPAEGAP